jgi:hypothetical protein
MLDERTIHALGYIPARLLPSGEWAGIRDMLFTTNLFVGIDESGWRTSYFYAKRLYAEIALDMWDGIGDPPGPWIKRNGDVAKLGPGAKPYA